MTVKKSIDFKTLIAAAAALGAATIFALGAAFSSPAAADDEMPFFRSEQVFEYDENRPANHASSLAEMPNGDLLATWFGGSSEGLADVALWAARKDARTGEWGKPFRIVDEPDLPEGNSVLFTDSKGKVWLFFVRKYDPRWDAWEKTKIFVQTSDDSGFNWSKERVLTDEIGWIIRNGVLELPDGRLILPVYTDTLPKQSFVWISDDGFQTWESRPVPVSDPNNLQPAFVNPEGDVLLMFARNFGVPGKTWFAYSKDLGKTWSEPKKMSFFPNPDSGMDAIGLKSGGIVYAWDDSPYIRTPLKVALSEDKGKKWPFQRTLETQSYEFSYPYLIQSKDGHIHIIYTAHDRIYLTHAEFNEAWLKSEDKPEE